MIRNIFVAVVLTVLVALGNVASVIAYGPYTRGTVGIDVSHPNCSVSLPKTAFGIVGVNGGLVYSTNPCLKAQASHFGNLSLYINTGLNASSSSTYYQAASVGCNGDAYCAAYNYGHNAARHSIEYALSKGINSSTWWLDVETMNTWNADVLQNQKSLQGAYDALSAHGATTIGAYSTTYQWNTITGGWKNGWPSWGATTWTTAKQASTYCKGREFTGGTMYLIQFKSKRSQVSEDYAC